jgi:hypothetical protein
MSEITQGFALAAESLSSALGRVVGLLRHSVRGLPIRDMAEALAGAEAAQEWYLAALRKASE